MTSVDQQQLQLLHQIQQHLLSNNQVFWLYLAMSLPFPVSWRLSFYSFISSLPLPPLSPVAITLLVILGPIGLIIVLYFFLKGLLAVLRLIAPFIISLFKKKEEDKKIIQLIFPADTSKSAYATEQLYTLLHTLSRQIGFWDKMLQRKNEYSLEIVSTKKEGIRYLLAAHPKFIDIISRSLLSYLPGIKVKEVNDYLDTYLKTKALDRPIALTELKLSSHFALPLETQKTLSENDPISYLTGNMTKLLPNELISFQLVVSPVLSSFHQQVVAEIRRLRHRLYKGLPLTEAVQKNSWQKFVSLPIISTLWFLVKGLWRLVSFAVMFAVSLVIGVVDTSGESVPFLKAPVINLPQDILNPYEKELAQIVKSKIDQSLLETSIRILVVSTGTNTAGRLNGILASFGQLNSPYQTFTGKRHLFPRQKAAVNLFCSRQLSPNTPLNPNPILSTSEISDLYHFPYARTTKTEDLVKVHSRELPAPLSLKNNNNLDVVFGKNNYGGTSTAIGLTDDDRSRHVYIIGQTGSGKSTIMFHMAKDDIKKGRGVAVVDPHGDLAEDLLTTIPEDRLNDCVYFNPFDLRYPIGINLLELTPGLEEDELEQEKELVCESVVSVFRRVFTSSENNDAHRIEYILRNTIYTAFTVKGSTIFTIYDLLNDPKFQKEVVKQLKDENLRNFWRYEFGRAGSYQVVKMVSGVTAKVGRFLFSPTARRILEQPRSTINFDDIIESGKILICNLAEGKLGEDTAQLLGTTVIAKIQQAALRRVRSNKNKRSPYYLFIDEFQNFATKSFIKLLSGGRKFGLRLTIAEQSTSQQEDRNVVNVILANTGTVICFRTASPIDEQLMLSQFKPYVESGDIINLPRYRFYIKLSAVEPEEPFSGKTLPIILSKNKAGVGRLIAASRKNYAKKYEGAGIGIKPAPPKTKDKKAGKQPADEDIGTLL